jgi:molybdopterin/thiamine biosynthesis adenylyltransferase
MGVQQMALADFDTVQPENLATQLHRVSDVGKLKVVCVAETLRMFSDEITTLARPIRIINGDQLNGNLVVGAVDGIQTRKQVWAATLAGRVDWFLDTRMAAEEYQHFLVDMSNDDAIRNYDDQLARLTDENVPDAPCTSKATMYCAFMSAGHIGAVLKAIVTGEAISHRLVHHIPSNSLMTFQL